MGMEFLNKFLVLLVRRKMPLKMHCDSMLLWRWCARTKLYTELLFSTRTIAKVPRPLVAFLPLPFVSCEHFYNKKKMSHFNRINTFPFISIFVRDMHLVRDTIASCYGTTEQQKKIVETGREKKTLYPFGGDDMRCNHRMMLCVFVVPSA